MKDLFDYVDQNSARFIEEYRKYLQQPSISAQDKGIKECAELLKDMMQDVGINSKVMPTDGHPVVFGELKSKKLNAKTLLLYAHYDVQPPEPYEEWESPPFAAEIRDGKIYARGATDDKQNFIHLKAAEAFLKIDGDVPVNLKFLYEGEEEIGSKNLGKYMKENKELLACDACIDFDGPLYVTGQPMIVLASKGLLTIELRSKTASRDLHSSRAAIVTNPAWRLISALSSMKDSNDRILIDGWYDNLEAPTPSEREYLEKLPFDEEELKKEYGVSAFINDVTGVDVMEKLLYDPTCTVIGFEAGYRGPGFKTVTPHKAFVKVGFRLIYDQTTDDCIPKLKAHLKKYGYDDIELIVHGTIEPAKYLDTEPIFVALMDAYKQVWDVEPIVLPNNMGSGPAYLFDRHLGISRCKTGIGPQYSRSHAPNEFMSIDNLFKGIKASIAMIKNYSNL